MEYGTIILIALALAFDAFAVAVAAGIKLGCVSKRQTFRLAFHFGLFQALMNVAGWAAGLSFRMFIESVAHWVAFALLGLVGLNMIRNALFGEKEDVSFSDPTKGATMVILSVATSIDALAVGLSFAVMKTAILLPASIIGIVAMLMTAAGLHLGCLVGSSSKMGIKAEILGGIVLLAIGMNILFEHGVFEKVITG